MGDTERRPPANCEPRNRVRTLSPECHRGLISLKRKGQELPGQSLDLTSSYGDQSFQLLLVTRVKFNKKRQGKVIWY